MAYCRDCGETLSIDARKCPSCGRAVGMSTIGPALERQASPRARRLLVAAAGLLVVALGAGFLAARTSPEPTRADFEAGARVAARTLVRVGVPGGRDEAGVVLRRIGDALLVATLTSAAPAGAELRVTANGASAEGLTLLHGRTKEVSGLAVVVVPDGGALGREEIRVAARPDVGRALVALSPGGQPLGAGRVLSFEDGDAAGSLVHDASLTGADRGAGLFDAEGRLVALATFPDGAGESLAVAASALFERLLLHEVALTEAWSEHALPLPRGAVVGVLARGGAGPAEARVGDKGRVVRASGRSPRALSFLVDESGALQLQAPGASRALVVTLAPF